MPTKKQLAAMAADNDASGEAAQAADVVTAPRDLADPAVQDAIRNPKPVVLTIGGEPIELYPLAAKPSRQFVVLVADLVGDATSDRNRAMPAGMRVAVALNGNDDLTTRLSRHVARALYAPDANPSEQDLERGALRIDEEANFNELTALFDHMCALNRIAEVFGKK